VPSRAKSSLTQITAGLHRNRITPPLQSRDGRLADSQQNKSRFGKKHLLIFATLLRFSNFPVSQK
ncbi:MAG TPA: hypothetical protein VFC39_18175, partial [Acidobacteriaceae bacterium]|nr:hypothetical protein [Acidobacteriaceae bacterium]